MKTLQNRIGKIEAHLHSLDAPRPDFSQMTEEELMAFIEEAERQTIRRLGEVEGRKENERIRNMVKNMTDEELERIIKR